MEFGSPSVRMLLVGAAGSEFQLAAAMARESGAEVVAVDSLDAAVAHLRQRRSNSVMIDVCFDVPAFLEQLRAEKIAVPVLACGIDAPAPAAVAAVRAGARDYVPLPPERELIAAAIALLAAGDAGAIEVEALVGHTVADVERELILHTLERCHGNRTSASTILGISVRTMRNKLRTFIEAGIPVSPAL
ncbi:helix-turn-helix domain-containing protein [Sphingosinicella sp. LY1275]|uniref:helix-turn-helix domain-containing protein n=1 Tax=Sphingosinicella sp. LY1275 TaxID=3095379 RepID=UPI002ADEE701|nr:helix-turn-helix domain-containing protein [Sphingosinicella sp. LY1275]MEA1013981.1 helix-turn-helix domain-containing protein [Sphingosinicella sp. LY1275]